MKRLFLALLAVLALAGSVNAAPIRMTPFSMSPFTTWFVRTDGGTQVQCTGTTNAPYTGGTGQPCGFNHPFELLHHAGLPFTWNIAPNDTVQFEDVGPYYMGQGPNKGLGQSWPACVGDPADCNMPFNMPSGVHILGFGAGACHDSNHTTLVNPTELSGINGVFWVWTAQGAVNADIECLKVTQPDTCTKGGQSHLNIPTVQMTSGTATYGFTTPDSSEQPPVPTELVTVSGITNGAYNFSRRNISTVTYTSFNVTGSQVSGGDLIITYSSVVGFPLSNGDGVALSGLTNGGGGFNKGGSPTGGVAISSVTGTTFHIAGLGLPTTGFQAETGTGIDNWSGHFTITGLSGSFSQTSESGAFTFAGQCANGDNYATNGFVMEYQTAQGPKNSTIKDLGVEGIASEGILGSHYNTVSGDTDNFSDWYIYASGTANIDGDGGGCNTSCESIGTINMSYIDAEWAGCSQVSPGVYTNCIDQAFSGNGDAVVLVATGGTWNFSHMTMKHSMQDCFDSLHTGDDPSNLPTLNANYIYSEGCEGQAIKMSGGDVTLRNSIGISNCLVMTTPSNFPSNPVGWNAFIGLPCRANNSFVLTASDGHTLTVQNVDNIGQQTVGWDLVNIGPTGCSNSTCKAIFQNNTTKGFTIGSGAFMSGIYFGDVTVNPFANPGSAIDHNGWFDVSTGCPNVSPYETNYVCGNPLFVAQSDVNNINANLLSGSPYRGAGTALIAATSPDFNGNTRPSPEAIGYVEFIGGALPTATFTANSLVMHAGDQVPPLTYVVTGSGYTPSIYTANFTGKVAITTTATSASSVGTYPITVATGTLSSSTYTPAYVAGTMTVIAPDGKGAIINNAVTHPAGFMYDVTAHGVSNSCTGTDQAPAINTILHAGRTQENEYFNAAKYLYFPAGCYEIHTTIQLWGDAVTFEGDGPKTSYFYAPPGFFNSGVNTAILKTDNVASNQNFRIYFQNFGIIVGPGNPNATGMDFLANNTGSIENVLISSEDSAAAICLTTARSYDGPALSKNMGLYGCQIGWNAAPEAYNHVAENLTMEAQQTVGITSNGFPLALRNVLTCMIPTAFATSSTNANVLNSEFLCGGGSNTALTNSGGGTLYVNGVTCSGYLHCLTDTTGSVTLASPIVERWTGTAQTLFGGTPVGALPLPVNETPLPSDPAVGGWIALGTNPATWTTALATCSSTTAWAPGVSINYSSGGSFIPVVIPACITHIIGYNLGYTGDGSSAIQWQVNANSATPIIIDRFGAGSFMGNHNSPRTVVMRDGQYGSYAATAGAGDVYFEDVAIIGPTTTILAGQNVWARQLNLEPTSTDKLVCGGPATMWILGYKTERPASSLTLTANCRTNIFGSLFYPLSGGTALTSITNSSLFMNWFELVYGAGQGSAHLVTETQGATTLTLDPSNVNSSQNLNMYYTGFSAATPMSISGSVMIGGTTRAQ